MYDRIRLVFNAGLVIGALLLVGTKLSSAAVPSEITVQGILTDASGAPLPPGSYILGFKIFDAQENGPSAGGNQLWPLNSQGYPGGAWEQDLPPDFSGLWTVSLGSDGGLQDDIFNAAELWLEVSVQGGSMTGAEPLPRIRLNSSAYSHRVYSVNGSTGGAIQGNLNVSGRISASEITVHGGPNGSNSFYVAQDGTVGTGGGVYPLVDAGLNLGTSVRRWNTVYAANGTINTSDARLKENVEDIGYGLDELRRLRPVTFTWKNKSDGRVHLGLIAQEVEAIVPEVVERADDPDAPLGINYASLIPVLIKAIQEQQGSLWEKDAQLIALRKEVVALKEENLSQETRLSAIEEAVHLNLTSDIGRLGVTTSQSAGLMGSWPLLGGLLLAGLALLPRRVRQARNEQRSEMEV